MTFPDDATTGSTALHDLAAVSDFVLALLLVGGFLACTWAFSVGVVWILGRGKTPASPFTSNDDHSSK